MLRKTIDMMHLPSYPGLLDQSLSFTGAAKLTQAAFLVLALQAANAGVRMKNGQDKSLGDTLHKEKNAP